MKKYILLLILFMLFHSYSHSQNLVANPSFEELNWCPVHYHDFYSMKDCFCAIIGSPNAHNACSPNTTSGAGVPDNIFGYQYPRTGKGYASEGVINILLNLMDSTITDSTSIAEIFGMRLNKSLIKGVCYQCSFYVSIGNRISNIATDAISMFLYTDSLAEPHGDIPEDSILKYHPQINNPSGNIIDDTLNWVKIEGEFVADGNEKYLYIGDFKRLRDVKWKFIPYTDFLSGTYGLYYIDDVSVYPCDAPVYMANAGKDTCVNAGNSITIGTPRRNEYLYWWYDMQGNLLDTTAILTVSPTQTTSYILVQKDFKFDETRDTVTISVGNCPISGISFEIYPNPCNGEVKVRFNGTVPAGSVMQIYDMVGRQIAQYPLAGTGNIATVNFGELATGVYHATVVVPDVMKKSVKLVVVRND